MNNTPDPVEQPPAARLVCIACAAEAHAAGDTAATVNLADVIAGGNSVCYSHIQFADRPPIPGQLPSGLYLPGQTS